MNIDKLIENYFSDKQALSAYMFARLSNDLNNAPPPVSSYQSPERLEDVLFTIYSRKEFSLEQKEWFWNALNTHAENTWQEKNSDIFGHAVYLYIRLGRDEANEFKWRNFLGIHSIRWRSDMPNDEISLYSSALWLLNRWNLVANSFWGEQFSAITALISEDARLIRPLNHVCNAMGEFKARHWEQLFVACNNLPVLREMLEQYVLIHFGECSGDAAKERVLIENIRLAIRAVKGNLKNISRPLCKMISTWKTLAWTADVKGDIGNLMDELTPKTKKNVSPMKYGTGTHTSQNRLAA